MKKTKMMIAALVIASSALMAQEIPVSQVPSLVSTGFMQAFPKASDVEWEKEGEAYKVEFDTGWFTDDQEAWFDKTGKLIRHEEEISVSDLPKAVRSAIKSQYAAYSIDDAEKITTNGTRTYEVELDGKSGDIDLEFDEQGKVTVQ